MNSFQNAFLIQEEAKRHYNQISSDTIYIYFKLGELDQLFAFNSTGCEYILLKKIDKNINMKYRKDAFIFFILKIIFLLYTPVRVLNPDRGFILSNDFRYVLSII